MPRRRRKFLAWSERPLPNGKARAKAENLLPSRRWQKPILQIISVYSGRGLIAQSMDESFEHLLAARFGHRVEFVLVDVFRDRFERHLPLQDFLAEFAVPAFVAVLDKGVDLFFLDEFRRVDQSFGQRINGVHMS